MVQAHRRKWIEPFTNYIEAPIAIQQPLLRASRYLRTETKIGELFIRGSWNRDGLVSKRR